MKLIRSFSFAFNGLKICFASEANFRIHLLLAVAATALGIGFSITSGEWLAVLFCMMLVMAMEMMNTAVEKLCDVTQKELHPGIKAVKDIAAGAVFISAVFSLLTGLVVFAPKIIVNVQSLLR